MFESWNVPTILVRGGVALLFYISAEYLLLLALFGLTRRQPRATLGYLQTVSIQDPYSLREYPRLS
jgi:hypothetical protein